MYYYKYSHIRKNMKTNLYQLTYVYGWLMTYICACVHACAMKAFHLWASINIT